MRLLAAFVVLLALPATAAERFVGADAALSAAAYIDRTLSYPSDYTPGKLAVEYVGVYDGAFMTQIRFTPSNGHQVVLGKGLNARARDGSNCADFRIIVEKFSAESLATLERDKSNVPLFVDSVDSVRGIICVLTPKDISVDIDEITVARPAGWAAFASPFAIAPAAVGGGL